MKKKLLVFLSLAVLMLGLASCNQTTTIIYQQADEASVEKIESTVTEVYDKVSKGCVGILCTNGTSSSSGSGVIYKVVDKTYYVVTNAHVIKDAENVKVYLGDGEYRFAKTVGYDEKNDIGVVTFVVDLYPTTHEIYVNDIFNYAVEDVVAVGQTVLAIGCPLQVTNFNILATGVISSVNELEISHNADINPGNSGGGLFNLQGRLVGLNYQGVVWTTSEGERIPVQGRFFAIPLNTIKKCITDIEAGGIIEHPIIGITSAETNSLLENTAYKQFKDYLPADNKFNHVVIQGVNPGSAADKAGIMENDVFVSINGKEIQTLNDLSSVLNFRKKGDTFEFVFYRSSESKVVTITLTL